MTSEATTDEGSVVLPSPTEPTHHDHHLAHRFAAGEPDAVRELYALWAGPVYTIAISRLGERHLAEEAVQETFVKAWQASASFDTERRLGPWLYTIARRVAMDIARRERRRPTTTALPPATPAPDVTTLNEVWEEWEVRCALRDLPPDDRELIRLTHYIGLTQSEIARRLGLALGTVKSRIHRAHRRLAEHLGHLRVTS